MQNYQFENQIQKQEKQPFVDDIKKWTYILISDAMANRVNRAQPWRPLFRSPGSHSLSPEGFQKIIQ